MRNSITVALGTQDPATLQIIKEVTFAYQVEQRSRLHIDFMLAQAPREPVRDIASLVKQAVERAHQLRKDTKTSVAVASATGRIELLYNKGARRTRFMTRAIASVSQTGLIFMKVPGSCPNDALEVFDAQISAYMGQFSAPIYASDSEIYAAEVATIAWAEVPHLFPKPGIEMLT